MERISWFRPIDYEILSYFGACDMEATPKVISANIDYDRQYTQKRLVRLVEADLLIRESGLYALSDRGRAYLDGDLDASDLDGRP